MRKTRRKIRRNIRKTKSNIRKTRYKLLKAISKKKKTIKHNIKKVGGKQNENVIENKLGIYSKQLEKSVGPLNEFLYKNNKPPKLETLDDYTTYLMLLKVQIYNIRRNQLNFSTSHQIVHSFSNMSKGKENKSYLIEKEDYSKTVSKRIMNVDLVNIKKIFKTYIETILEMIQKFPIDDMNKVQYDGVKRDLELLNNIVKSSFIYNLEIVDNSPPKITYANRNDLDSKEQSDEICRILYNTKSRLQNLNTEKFNLCQKLAIKHANLYIKEDLLDNTTSRMDLVAEESSNIKENINLEEQDYVPDKEDSKYTPLK
jgi:hypothetical protein